MEQRINLLEPGFFQDPYGYYDRMRAMGRLIPLEVPRAITPLYGVSHYADVGAMLKDPRYGRTFHGEPLSKRNPALFEAIAPLLSILNRWMLFMDPPHHTRLRGLVNKAFTPRVAERLRPSIQETTDHLLDEMAALGGGDLIAAFTYPLPVMVIAALLGVPLADRSKLREWSELLGRTIDTASTFDDHRAAVPAAVAMGEMLKQIIADRREHPQEDLITGLLRAQEADESLTEDEIIATCVLLLIAGHETTTNLIANGMLALLQHPEQLRALREDPELITPAVEEMLRYDPPAQQTARSVQEDHEWAGQELKKGDQVLLLLAAANRDPAQFPDPTRFDITRQENRHLSFGGGIHFCLGAPLARAEAQIAVLTLVRRFPNLSLAASQVEWLPSLVFRNLKELPVNL
ncbi:MAG: cytochrome P450 [Bacillota bacterium]